MIRINLLPVREARRRADVQQQLLLLVALLVLAVGAVAWTHLSLRSDIAATKTQVAQIQAQIKKFEPQLKKVEAYKQKKNAVEQKLGVIRDLETSRSGPVHMMDELATRTPDRVWLTSLESDNGRLKISGKSLDNEIVATFLTSLNDSPYFGDVELRGTELESREGLKLHQFDVTALLQNPEAEKKTTGGAEAKPGQGGGAASGR